MCDRILLDLDGGGSWVEVVAAGTCKNLETANATKVEKLPGERTLYVVVV